MKPARVAAVASYLLLFAGLDVAPVFYYAKNGAGAFAVLLQQQAGGIQSWDKWHVVMLDAESKLDFYLSLPPTIEHFGVTGPRNLQTTDSLVTTWPILKNKPANTIFITRKIYAPLLVPFFKDYRIIELKQQDSNAPIAFVPTNNL